MISLFATGLACSLFGQAFPQFELIPWAEGLGLGTDVTHGGDERLFVARQYGAVFLVRDSGDVSNVEFLNIASQVLNNGERGLLGLAFDPDFQTNGHFYVNYVTGTGNGVTRISRFTVGSDPDVADPSSEVVLLSLPQPHPIHNGGGLAFGPDGYLYCSLGDGGGAEDPNDQGQDLSSLFGTILRIKPEADGSYSIPTDNPFAGAEGDTLPEIWAYGLRNPYRIGLDPQNGDLWIGDVGEASYEEVDHWPGGLNTGPNFGWRCYEGNMPFNTTDCPDIGSLVFPVTALAHGTLGGTACAVVAGEVYRGSAHPSLFGRHVYTDFCSGELRTLTPDGTGGWTDELLVSTGLLGLSSIGADLAGELYVTGLIDGILYKLVDRCADASAEIVQVGDSLFAGEGLDFQWYLNDTSISGATDAYLPIPGNGSYEAEVQLTNGCRVRTAAYPYFSTGTEAVAAMRTWMDATGRVHLLVPGGSPTQQELTILDTQGRILERMVMAAHTTELPLPEVPGAGIRLVRVVGPQGSWTLPYVAP
ncbi:MAG: PQQ-dependent sugar dehydrogenase [Flavobacteriales bacterium]